MYQVELSRLVAERVWFPLVPVYVVAMATVPLAFSVTAARGFSVLTFDEMSVEFAPVNVISVPSSLCDRYPVLVADPLIRIALVPAGSMGMLLAGAWFAVVVSSSLIVAEVLVAVLEATTRIARFPGVKLCAGALTVMLTVSSSVLAPPVPVLP